jgi:hypothetical protein
VVHFFVQNIVPTLTAVRIYTISTNIPLDAELRFERTDAAFTPRLLFDATERLWPIKYGANRYYQSAAHAAQIALRKAKATEWWAAIERGTWAAA